MHRRAGVLLWAAACLAAGAAADAGAAVLPRDDARLREAVTVEGILRHARALDLIARRNGGTRASGTPGYDASAAYVAGELRRAGYRVELQPFEFAFFRDLAPPTLVRTAPGREAYEADVDFATFLYSGSGELSGARVVPIDLTIPPAREPGSTSGCERADFRGRPRPGSVALLQRGTCDFQVKANLAEEAGYAAAIIFNEGQEGREELFGGTLVEPETIPVLATTYELGRDLALLARAGRDVRVSLSADTLTEDRATVNVLADAPGGDASRTVVVGAHLDSVPEGPGINDNGSGTATILETALQLRRLNLPLRNRVRFAFWGAEEEGLFGSAHYVAGLSRAQKAATLLNLNFDMLGSPNYVRFVYDGDGSATPDDPDDAGPAGSDEIERVLAGYFAARGLRTDPTPFDGRSDYGSFIEVGIPAGGLFSGAEEIKTEREARIYGGEAGAAHDRCYHQACDDLANLSERALDELGDGAAHAILAFADRRGPLARATPEAALAASARSALPYRGGHLRR